jgi:hypothetical protein
MKNDFTVSGIIKCILQWFMGIGEFGWLYLFGIWGWTWLIMEICSMKCCCCMARGIIICNHFNLNWRTAFSPCIPVKCAIQFNFLMLFCASHVSQLELTSGLCLCSLDFKKNSVVPYDKFLILVLFISYFLIIKHHMNFHYFVFF